MNTTLAEYGIPMTAGFARLGCRRPTGRGQKGQGLAEYVIVLVGLAIVAVAIIVSYGGRLQGLFGTADDEVGALASGDYVAGGGIGSDGNGPGGNSPSGAGESGSGTGNDDGFGDDGFGSGGTGSSAGASDRSTAGAGGREAWRSDRRGDGVVRPSRETRRGQYEIGDGADRVTVVAPSRGEVRRERASSPNRGSGVRQTEEARWDRKRREAIEEPSPRQSATGGKRVISFLGIVMIGLLGLCLAAIARFGMAAFGSSDS